MVCLLQALGAFVKQYNIADTDGYIGTVAHGNSDVAACQSDRVVDAVSRHDDDVPLLMKTVNECCFLLRQQSGIHLPDADLLCDPFRTCLMIAGEHHHADTHLLDRFDRLFGTFTEPVTQFKVGFDLSAHGKIVEGMFAFMVDLDAV